MLHEEPMAANSFDAWVKMEHVETTTLQTSPFAMPVPSRVDRLPERNH